MIEPALTHRGRVTQAALHLVSDGKRNKKCCAIGVGQLRGGKYCSEVIGGMTRLARGKIAVIEIEVSNEGSVQECGPIRRAPSTANERAWTVEREVCDEAANASHRISVNGSECAPERVENSNSELETSRLTKNLYPCVCNELRHLLDNGHATSRVLRRSQVVRGVETAAMTRAYHQ
jgi:hypothetical protein